MLIIWKKYGILTPVIFFGGVFLTQFLSDSAFGQHYYAQHKIMHGVGCLTSSAVLFGLGWLLDAKQEPNTFFFIPMKYWALAGAIFGIVTVVTGK